MSSNVISIDGPSGSGKTSIGKMLSARLKADFLSSGLIYRMITINISEISKDDKYKQYISDLSIFYKDCLESRVYIDIVYFFDSFI